MISNFLFEKFEPENTVAMYPPTQDIMLCNFRKETKTQLNTPSINKSRKHPDQFDNMCTERLATQPLREMLWKHNTTKLKNPVQIQKHPADIQKPIK